MAQSGQDVNKLWATWTWIAEEVGVALSCNNHRISLRDVGFCANSAGFCWSLSFLPCAHWVCPEGGGGGGGGAGPHGNTVRQAMDGLWTEVCGQQNQSNGPGNNQHNPQYANYWAPLTRTRHIPTHSAQPRHTNDWAPRTRKRHQQEHRPTPRVCMLY